jgi:hypothetical protein
MLRWRPTGTYDVASQSVVTIACFQPKLTVIASKQRPRKITLLDSAGQVFLHRAAVVVQAPLTLNFFPLILSAGRPGRWLGLLWDKLHLYLLKGQEDPRMDERIMEFLGLVNKLLLANPHTRG